MHPPVLVEPPFLLGLHRGSTMVTPTNWGNYYSAPPAKKNIRQTIEKKAKMNFYAESLKT